MAFAAMLDETYSMQVSVYQAGPRYTQVRGFEWVSG